MNRRLKNLRRVALCLMASPAILSAQGAVYGASSLYVTGNVLVAISSTSFNTEAAPYYSPSVCEVHAATLTYGVNSKTFSDGQFSPSYTLNWPYDPSLNYQLGTSHTLLFKYQYSIGSTCYYSDPCNFKYDFDRNIRGDAGKTYFYTHTWSGDDTSNPNYHFTTDSRVATMWRSVAGQTFNSIAPLNFAVSPQGASLQASQSISFVSTRTGGPSSGSGFSAVNWSIDPAVGSIDPSGIYHAPAYIATKQTIVVKATSVTYPSRSGSATLTVNPVAVSVGLRKYLVHGATMYHAIATVSGTPNTAVIWSSQPGSTIDTNGYFSADTGVWWVTATSVADPSKSATESVTIAPIVIQPPPPPSN